MAKAYPIPAQILFKEGAPPIIGAILKLTTQGFLFQLVGVSAIKLGDELEATFEIPALEFKFVEKSKVIKTYLQWAQNNQNEKIKVQWIEFHFLSIGVLDRKRIMEFASLINQK